MLNETMSKKQRDREEKEKKNKKHDKKCKNHPEIQPKEVNEKSGQACYKRGL